MSQRQSLPTNGSGKKALGEGFLTLALSAFDRRSVARRTSVVLGFLSQSPKLFFKFLQVPIGEIFKIDKLISCALQCADYLIKFEMHRFGVTVLRVLNQEDHQKRNDRRCRVNYQLPRIGKMKSGASYEPDKNDKHGSSKRPRATEHRGTMLCEHTKRVSDDAKEITLLLVLS